MSEFKNSTAYLLSNPNKTMGLPSEKLSIPPRLQFTIGRSHENTLQILDNTISKKHSKISNLKGSYFVSDLSSANGIYLNGSKVQGQAQLEDGDCLQFGKYECLYQFVDPASGSRNKSRGKGKINLKDYLFEQNPMEKNKSKNISQFENGQQSVLTQPISNKRQMPIISATQQNINRKKVKPKQSKIRIPDLSDYLKLTNGSNEELQINKAQDLGDTGKKYTRSRVNGPVKQGKIKLHSLEGEIPTDEDLKQFRLQKREKNIYVQQQQALQNIERQKRRLEQQKLKKELQQAKIAEDLLQKQLLIQQKVREEQEKVNKQKERLQEQFVKREQLKRQQQLAKLKQIQQKQRQMMSKIQQQRNRQQEQLRIKEQQIKQQSQSQYRKEYQKRKTELQTQAEALARQYENIYRETIKKVKTQIDNQQNTIQTQEKKQNQLIQSNQNLNKDIKLLEDQIYKLKNQFIVVNGRNKACILYASDIQDKIDGLGVKDAKVKQDGYYCAGNNKAGALRKIQDSVLNARKLLKIKQKQYDKVMEEILSLTASIKQKQYGTSSEVADFLDTINENTQLISNLKKEYLELLEEQKAVQQIWENQLSQNTELQNKNRVLQSQITKNMSQIEQNTRDQIKKSTQQRLHMLKIMYHCPQNKKNAARFLIEQMLTIEQETHRFRTKNEQMHKKITKIISQTQKYKRQNQYLSEILFSQDENGHHFDNMKVVINNLLAKIEAERASNNVSECLQLASEAFKYELMIQNQIQRKKGLKENMRKICEMGLAPTQIKVSSKNPLVFFGDLLTNKQIEIERKKSSIFQMQNEANKIKSEIKVLDEKRSKISQALQKYKVEQLSEARRLLGKQNNGL